MSTSNVNGHTLINVLVTCAEQENKLVAMIQHSDEHVELEDDFIEHVTRDSTIRYSGSPEFLARCAEALIN